MVPTIETNHRKTVNRSGNAGSSLQTRAGERSSPLRWGSELLLRLILGGVFIYSGGMKLLDPAAFQAGIANFQLLPWGLSGLVAVYLPWLEIVCGGALILKKQSWGALFVLALLMVGFIFFLGNAWARGLDVSCGCFGAADSTSNYPLAIARNLLNLAGLAAIPWLGRRSSGGMK